MLEWIAYGLLWLFLGTAAGFMAGILGLGGGMVVVPGLLYIFSHGTIVPPHLAMHFATGTSLASMAFTASAAARAHYHNGYMLWSAWKPLIPGLIIGALFGAIVAQFIPTDWLETFFGFFLLLMAYKLYAEVGFEPEPRVQEPWIDGIISMLVGFFSGLLGIGGGTMIIPYLTHRGISIRKAAPVSALCTMTVAVAGTLVLIITGFFISGLPKYTSGYIYWPAVAGIVIPAYFATPLGVRLTRVLPISHLKYIFIAMVLMVAVSMFI